MNSSLSAQPPAQDLNLRLRQSASNDTSERPGTQHTVASEAPTLIRQFPQEPRFLDRNYNRTGGSEAASWRQDFVKVIETHTSEMTIDERTDFFETCITRNKDRYIQTFAAYYGRHPEHIPDRPGGVKSTQQEREGMREKPEIQTRQDKLFGRAWSTTSAATSPFDHERSFVPDTVAGPRNEPSPYAELPTCKHCIVEARKEKWRRPFSTLGRMFSTKAKSQANVTSRQQKHDVATSTASPSLSASTAASSSKSSLKYPTVPRLSLSATMLPTEPAQHIENQA